MKKLFMLTVLIIIIPFFVAQIFTKVDKTKYHQISNNYIRVKDEETGDINEIEFEEYIKGVVAAEMPANFELEALKAQAVASRSYAMYKIEGNKNNNYDVVNTTNNQVYLKDQKLKENWKEKYVEKITKIKTAIDETRGQYITYQGKTANAMFFSASSGKTENSEEVFTSKLPYLRSVDSKWDESSPVYTDINTFDLKDFYQKLNIPYNQNLSVKYKEKTSTGRIKIVEINEQEMKSSEFSQKLKLRSTYFNITQNNGKVTITTKGFGHGVGMSQYGANGMAKEGYDYKQILKHYYKDIEIKKL